ncbi:uncharacterized protein LOC124939725 [Impatiens glandulifera]|uniref:uncharacterized protein LOC124939725 n=1 Tax=Impatiens glandulifera TaxID=253017 RepID=UPI001FB09CF5|nr:uncharacterized protein LOC124939725 [Impatiens glandulifera]
MKIPTTTPTQSSSSSSSKKNKSSEKTTYLRYLKPGALAKIRDSRISAMMSSQRNELKKIEISPPPPPINGMVQSPPAEANDDGSVLCFTGRMNNGPRFPQRKKLMAGRSFFFTSPPPTDSPVDSSEDDDALSSSSSSNVAR